MVNRPLANAQNCGPMTKHAGRKCICSPAYYWSSEHHAIPFDQSEIRKPVTWPWGEQQNQGQLIKATILAFIMVLSQKYGYLCLINIYDMTYLSLYVDDNDNNMTFVESYCLFVALVVNIFC
jgi:hypothetical protein